MFHHMARNCPPFTLYPVKRRNYRLFPFLRSHDLKPNLGEEEKVGKRQSENASSALQCGREESIVTTRMSGGFKFSCASARVKKTLSESKKRQSQQQANTRQGPRMVVFQKSSCASSSIDPGTSHYSHHGIVPENQEGKMRGQIPTNSNS